MLVIKIRIDVGYKHLFINNLYHQHILDNRVARFEQSIRRSQELGVLTFRKHAARISTYERKNSAAPRDAISPHKHENSLKDLPVALDLNPRRPSPRNRKAIHEV